MAGGGHRVEGDRGRSWRREVPACRGMRRASRAAPYRRASSLFGHSHSGLSWASSMRRVARSWSRVATRTARRRMSSSAGGGSGSNASGAFGSWPGTNNPSGTATCRWGKSWMAPANLRTKVTAPVWPSRMPRRRPRHAGRAARCRPRRRPSCLPPRRLRASSEAAAVREPGSPGGPSAAARAGRRVRSARFPPGSRRVPAGFRQDQAAPLNTPRPPGNRSRRRSCCRTAPARRAMWWGRRRRSRPRTTRCAARRASTGTRGRPRRTCRRRRR